MANTMDSEDHHYPPGTVLVIDDDDCVLSIARRMLKYSGFDVLCASEGQEGIEIFQRHKDEIDLVVLDLTMPGLNGPGVFKKLVHICPEVKVLLSSGYSEEEVFHQLDCPGIAGFIQKPYQLNVLQAKIDQALNHTGFSVS
jgi:DNA-binding NtrC family response regulator